MWEAGKKERERSGSRHERREKQEWQNREEEEKGLEEVRE